MYSYAPVGPGIRVVLDSGRMPSAPSEVVLAPQTATALGVRVGRSVSLTGTTGRTRVMTVTGIGFVPPGSHCSGCSHASGAWVSDAGFDALFTTFQFHGGFVALRPGVSPQAVAERLQGLAPGLAGQDLFAQPYPPSAITELRAVQAFPLALAAFLALLALAAVGHALASAVRRRRHDIAVLRALGMTRRRSRVVVRTQAAVLAAAAVLLGVPLGVGLPAGHCGGWSPTTRRCSTSPPTARGPGAAAGRAPHAGRRAAPRGMARTSARPRGCASPRSWARSKARSGSDMHSTERWARPPMGPPAPLSITTPSLSRGAPAVGWSPAVPRRWTPPADEVRGVPCHGRQEGFPAEPVDRGVGRGHDRRRPRTVVEQRDLAHAFARRPQRRSRLPSCCASSSPDAIA